jgi:hypothetical protein
VNADALLEIARRHAGPEGQAYVFNLPEAKALRLDYVPNPSNTWQFAHEIEVFNEYAITPLHPG